MLPRAPCGSQGAAAAGAGGDFSRGFRKKTTLRRAEPI